MHKLYPYYTNDGSVGLFSPIDDDIYHSTYGALTEAYEKFILPADFKKYFENNNEIKILDICFGIGYNTKSFLNYFLENITEEKKHYNATIGTDNISRVNLSRNHENSNSYNESLDTDNISTMNNKNSIRKHPKRKIFIDAIDTDKNLAYLSPFFVTGRKYIKNNKINFKQEKISKLLNKKNISNIKLKKEIPIILLKLLLENNREIIFDKDFINILKNRDYSQYFDKYMLNLFEFYENKGCFTTSRINLKGFLHNIYYRYLSSSYKSALRYLKNNEITLNLKVQDARKALSETNLQYNYIFLDAFSPPKCPCLWTLEFFKLLYNKLDSNGMILTYSSAANVRNTFLEAGFYIGKIYNETTNKNIGTVAVKNKSLIKHELSEYDLGLLKTKAGIIYRDENLSLTNEVIIENNVNNINKSDLISSSKYIKQYKRKNSGGEK